MCYATGCSIRMSVLIVMYCNVILASFLVIPILVYGQEECSAHHYEGVSSNVEVACGFNGNFGPTLWIINGSIYDLRKESNPYVLVDGIYAVDIPEINLCLNDTTFQCLSSTRHPAGREIKICVRRCKFI